MSWTLICGYGSIGRRHYQNLRRLGCADVRLLRSGPARDGRFDTPDGVAAYADLAVALADRPTVVIVANPTSLHARTARAALAAGASVLLEKPVASDLDSARSLQASATAARGACGVAYCFRYHPLYRALKDAVTAGRLGRVFHARSWQAGYLPAWHPWEDYRTSYAARTDLGGGVVRTLDHDLDMLRWILGPPRRVQALASNRGLGLDVEDTADILLDFEAAQAHVHVSFARRDYSRGMSLVGDQGSADLDWNGASLTVRRAGQGDEITRLPADFDLNTIYVDMVRDAMAAFAEDPPRAAIALADGVAALEIALGALESNTSLNTTTFDRRPAEGLPTRRTGPWTLKPEPKEPHTGYQHEPN